MLFPTTSRNLLRARISILPLKPVIGRPSELPRHCLRRPRTRRRTCREHRPIGPDRPSHPSQVLMPPVPPSWVSSSTPVIGKAWFWQPPSSRLNRLPSRDQVPLSPAVVASAEAALTRDRSVRPPHVLNRPPVLARDPHGGRSFGKTSRFR